ncbi:MAG TPA: segregation/condensation protein A [Bacteroidota bacterium]
MYKVKLSDFEGPLDLLLFFIKRDELNIYDIPIAKITQDYLDSLHLMAALDLEVAGEFIVMAATLMQIKVRMLLPRDETRAEEEDPRAELVRRLIEYKRFKEVSQGMSKMEDEQRRLFYRRFFLADTRLQSEEDNEESLKEITLFNLVAAYKTAIDHMPKKVVHEVNLLNVTVDEQMSFVMDYLRVHANTTLLGVVRHMTDKIRIIVTVIAILELTKNKVLRIRPSEDGADILIEHASHLQAVKVVPA